MTVLETRDLNSEQRRELICQMKIVNKTRTRQCEHIKTNGEFCGSPALRGRNYCYFHLTYIGRRLRAERVREKAAAYGVDPGVVPLELPPLEDANSVQMALMQVIDAILHNRIDNKRAGLVLYALQTASSNLARTDLNQMSGATVAGEYEDFEQDFELEDAAEELHTDEAQEEEEDRAAKNATIARIEEMAEDYAKLDAAYDQAAQSGKPDESDPNFKRGSYPCGQLSQFFCRLNGPLQHAQAGATQQPRLVEREAASQRLEIAARLRPEEEEAAA